MKGRLAGVRPDTRSATAVANEIIASSRLYSEAIDKVEALPQETREERVRVAKIRFLVDAHWEE
jgi:hypothetical protein